MCQLPSAARKRVDQNPIGRKWGLKTDFRDFGSIAKIHLMIDRSLKGKQMPCVGDKYF